MKVRFILAYQNINSTPSQNNTVTWTEDVTCASKSNQSRPRVQ